MQQVQKIRQKITLFLENDVWRIQLDNLGRIKALGVKVVRILLLSIRGFEEDKLPLRASALTFYSLLSLVPVLAMIFGIAKGFGFEKILENRLMSDFAGQEMVMEQMMIWAHRLLDSAKGGIIAGIGLVVLFYTVIKLLSHIEMAFNHIWGIKSARPLGRKFSDYLSLMLIAPVLMILSGGANVFITTQVTLILDKIALLGFFSPVILFLLQLVPCGVLWFLFTMVYMLLPNTHVNFSSGLIAGIFSGTVIFIIQWGYIAFQIGAARYNAIYGSFAALPLFLIWLQITWIVLLMGAEISFAHQNATMFEHETDEANASSALKKKIALCIAHHIIRRFALGQMPETATRTARSLQIPIRLTRNLINELVESRLLTVVQSAEEKEPAYQPAMDIHRITIQSVISAMEQKGENTVSFDITPAFDTLSQALADFERRVEAAPENKLLMDIK